MRAQHRIERSEELANRRHGEDDRCQMYAPLAAHDFDCGCRWEKGRGWVRECDAHE